MDDDQFGDYRRRSTVDKSSLQSPCPQFLQGRGLLRGVHCQERCVTGQQPVEMMESLALAKLSSKSFITAGWAVRACPIQVVS